MTDDSSIHDITASEWVRIAAFGIFLWLPTGVILWAAYRLIVGFFA